MIEGSSGCTGSRPLVGGGVDESHCFCTLHGVLGQVPELTGFANNVIFLPSISCHHPDLSHQ
jgi:hypothetical protein